MLKRLPACLTVKSYYYYYYIQLDIWCSHYKEICHECLPSMYFQSSTRPDINTTTKCTSALLHSARLMIWQRYRWMQYSPLSATSLKEIIWCSNECRYNGALIRADNVLLQVTFTCRVMLQLIGDQNHYCWPNGHVNAYSWPEKYMPWAKFISKRSVC